MTFESTPISTCKKNLSEAEWQKLVVSPTPKHARKWTNLAVVFHANICNSSVVRQWWVHAWIAKNWYMQLPRAGGRGGPGDTIGVILISLTQCYQSCTLSIVLMYMPCDFLAYRNCLEGRWRWQECVDIICEFSTWFLSVEDVYMFFDHYNNIRMWNVLWN